MSTLTPTVRPRSLADDFRLRSDAQLKHLITNRPDLIHPVPADISQLAARATTSPSVNAALDQLNAFDLTVCEVIAALPDPTTSELVHSALQAAAGYRSDNVDAAIQSLTDLGLIWGTSDEIHLVRVARESFGAYPCGLGPAMRDARRTVRDYEENPSLVETLLADAPNQVRDILEQLMWNPTGSMKNAKRPITIEKAKSPLEWLLAHEMIVATGDTTVAMPREVSLVLRNGLFVRTLESAQVDPITNIIETIRVNDTGAHAALDFIRLVETLLEAWAIEPPSQLRSGGLAQRDFTASCELLRTSEHITALTIEVAHAAGLVNLDDSSRWVPTINYDRWLNFDDATRWSALATAWHAMPRASHLVASDLPERISVLSPGVERGFIQSLRTTALDILREAPIGSTTSAKVLVAYLDWHRPRRSSHVRANAVKAVLDEAETLGITGAGALTDFGRLIMDAPEATAALARHLPAPVDHIIVQADLTALAPGRLLAVPRRTMAVLADVESTGVATTYRFTEQSIRRAFDQGQSAHEVLTFLTELSRTPLPQPLTYLIDDVARKHGVLRVGVASIYLRCDDAQLISALQVDRRLVSLKFREIAPGIVVSASPADIVLEKLRNAGYSPVAESAEGTVLIHRPDSQRTNNRPSPTAVTVSGPSPRLIDAAIKALRAGERVEDTKKTSTHQTPRGTSTQTLGLLNEALASGREVWIGYADRSGITTERIVEPLTISGGFLTAFDLRSNEVKTFTVARITGAQYADETEEGSTS